MTDAAETNLVFNWGPPNPRARALLIFIGISLLLHALCFYLFQVVYPPAVMLPPPPARVTLISTQSEDGRALLQWVDAEDPALVSATLRPPASRTRRLPRLRHVPSYMMERTQLKPLPSMTMDLQPPSPQPPGPVPTSHVAPPIQPAKAPTAVAFSEDLAALGSAAVPKTKFTATSSEQPENVRFRIAVNSSGEVQYSFPMNSSGDPSLDAQARQHVVLMRFPSPPASPNESLTWGIATVEWGADVARPPAPAASPAGSSSP